MRPSGGEMKRNVSRGEIIVSFIRSPTDVEDDTARTVLPAGSVSSVGFPVPSGANWMFGKFLPSIS
jgi:hypothetical protein